MQHGAMAFQPSYVLLWGSIQDGEPPIEITERPNVVWLADLIMAKDIEFSARILNHMKMANVDFSLPVEIRIQKLQQPNPNTTKTVQYSDVWECIEKAIEKNSQKEELSHVKTILKKLHSAYITDKLESLYEKPKVKKSAPQPESEQTPT